MNRPLIALTMLLGLGSAFQAADESPAQNYEAVFTQRRDAMIEGVRKNAPPEQLKNPGLAANLAARKLLLKGPGRVGPGRGAETGCEGVWGERGANKG